MYGFGRFRSPNAASKGGRRGLPNPRSLGWGREKPFWPESSIDLERNGFRQTQLQVSRE